MKIEYYKIYAELRKSKGLSQEQLSKQINCSKQYISKFENKSNNKPLPTEFLIAYADFFNVSTDYLLGRTDFKPYDINLTQINSYTGLSEKAIEMLHRIYESSSNRYLINKFNEIIENRTIFELEVMLNKLESYSCFYFNKKLSHKDFYDELDTLCDVVRYKAELKFCELLDSFDYRAKNKDKYKESTKHLGLLSERWESRFKEINNESYDEDLVD